MSDGRERFLRAIAEHIASERIEEVHLFPAMRQGGRETGVAVITVRPERNESADADDDGSTVPGDESPLTRTGSPPIERLTVYRARYALTLKGPDRGKWDVGVTEEADAPASAVDDVVRGVHERAGGADDEEPERLTGEAFRAALVEEPWIARE